ncbi:MAG: hypothetical protein EPO68_07165 [Planctomycetota bacterium]|nr:MAG: hypothetical protein EPO68_07165 [Planctomycetota bacterium]
MRASQDTVPAVGGDAILRRMLAGRIASLASVAMTSLAACRDDAPAAIQPASPKPRISVERQLEQLAQAGIALNPWVAEGDLVAFHTRAEFERAPFDELVETLGGEIGREPFAPICDRLWMCDLECVSDDGDYAAVLHRLERMTEGALHASEITDRVDLAANVAWLRFDCAGRSVQWDLRVDDDWMDPSLFRRYDELLREQGSALRLYSNESDYGQCVFLGAFTTSSKAAFDALVSVRLAPISGQWRESAR